VSPECPRTTGTEKAGNLVWEKGHAAIDDANLPIPKARWYLDESKLGQGSRTDDRERIQKELETLARKRQWVIAQAPKGSIREADTDYRLSELSVQEFNLRRELAETKDVIRLAAMEGCRTQPREHISDLQGSLGWLDAIPQDGKERHRQFEMKRRIVKSLVETVGIERDRNLRVGFHLDVAALLERAGMTAPIHSS
jgi:hypothetical protein